MVLPPGIQCRWSSVHGPLHVAKVGPAVLAGPIAPPPVLPVHIDFIVEAVVDLKRGTEHMLSAVVGVYPTEISERQYQQYGREDALTVMFVPLALLIRFMCLQNSGP